MLIGNVLGDGGDEFFSGEDFKILFVVPMGHGRAIEDLAGILDIGDLLFGEGVSQDVFGQRLLTIAVISGDLVSSMHTESAVAPVHQFFDETHFRPRTTTMPERCQNSHRLDSMYI